MKVWAERFYKSKAWEQCRYSFLLSKYFICERCGGAAIIAHHKKYLTSQNINNPEVSLNWDNLEALCHDCHNREHILKYETTREDVMFDEEGNLIESRVKDNNHTPGVNIAE